MLAEPCAGLVVSADIAVAVFWIPLYLIVRLIWTKRKLRRQQASRHHEGTSPSCHDSGHDSYDQATAPDMSSIG
jgi:hypothetical protein